jgi:cell division septal protein FtsQ
MLRAVQPSEEEVVVEESRAGQERDRGEAYARTGSTFVVLSLIIPVLGLVALIFGAMAVGEGRARDGITTIVIAVVASAVGVLVWMIVLSALADRGTV